MKLHNRSTVDKLDQKSAFFEIGDQIKTLLSTYLIIIKV